MAINGNNPNRQRMINLMYIVFIAMMAISVSSDVLDGFTKVNKSLDKTLNATQKQNLDLFNNIHNRYNQNPEKSSKSYQSSINISEKTKRLNTYIDSIKIEIAKATDGEKVNTNNISRKDYTDATNKIMLNPINGEAKRLKYQLEKYKKFALSLIGENSNSKIFSDILDTSNIGLINWETATFNNMPTVATITLLTKLQNDISIIESKVLSKLLKNIDYKDYRVNSINAEVIPNSRIITLGQEYSAKIILSSVDTTKRPSIYVDGKKLKDNLYGIYKSIPNKLGTFTIDGYITTQNNNGDTIKSNFKSEYTVVEPIATVAPKLMNVIYLGIDNPIEISIPEFSSDKILVSIDNGTIYNKGREWIIKPLYSNKDATIKISAKTEDNKVIPFGSKVLRVRSLPDPSSYIELKEGSNIKRFKGGRISKQELLRIIDNLSAAIDDNILDIKFDIQRFTVIYFDSMGNAMMEVSNSNKFSDRQIRQIKAMKRGTRLYITDIIAKGPDGSTRKISPMEIILK